MLFTYLQVESETNKTNFFECEAPAMKVNEKSCLPWSEKLITYPQSQIPDKFCRHHYASPHETELVWTELLNEMPNWRHPFEMNVMSNWMDLICIFLKYLLIFFDIVYKLKLS